MAAELENFPESCKKNLALVWKIGSQHERMVPNTFCNVSLIAVTSKQSAASTHSLMLSYRLRCHELMLTKHNSKKNSKAIV